MGDGHPLGGRHAPVGAPCDRVRRAAPGAPAHARVRAPVVVIAGRGRLGNRRRQLTFRDVEIVDPPAWLEEVLAEADADLAAGGYMSFGSVEEFDAYARQVTADDGQILRHIA